MLFVNVIVKVLRPGYQFTSEDETLEGKLTTLCEEFPAQLQVAVEHITLHAPLMIQTLTNQLEVFC